MFFIDSYTGTLFWIILGFCVTLSKTERAERSGIYQYQHGWR
jgi:hypothetical protein